MKDKNGLKLLSLFALALRPNSRNGKYFSIFLLSLSWPQYSFSFWFNARIVVQRVHWSV